ncbi:uncharacterized protein CBL_09516 [Carabus blaptoides fortunei]
MSDGRIPEQIKKFLFSSKNRANGDTQGESVEILIPELLQASYSFYTWPSAPILAWFLWEHRHELPHQRVLELGSGTALPGILAAKCGAQVTLSDSSTLPKSLSHIERCCQLNNLIVNRHIRVIGITWGLFLNNIFNVGPLDLILENNSGAKFLCTYQERSSDWSIEHLLTKWDLTCAVININNLGREAGIDIHELTVVVRLQVSSQELKLYFITKTVSIPLLTFSRINWKEIC